MFQRITFIAEARYPLAFRDSRSMQRTPAHRFRIFDTRRLKLFWIKVSEFIIMRNYYTTFAKSIALNRSRSLGLILYLSKDCTKNSETQIRLRNKCLRIRFESLSDGNRCSTFAELRHAVLIAESEYGRQPWPIRDSRCLRFRFRCQWRDINCTFVCAKLD